MSIPPLPNGFTAPHCAPRIQPPLLPQQSGLSSLDMSQPNPQDTHFNNTHVEPFPITASDVPRSSVQNVDPALHPFLVNGQMPSWDCLWPFLIPSLPAHSSHHSSNTQNSQNTQATSSYPTFPTHPTSGPFQFGGGQPAPAVQDHTATSTAAASSSSSCPNSTAPYTAPPVPEATLFRPGVADAGPTTANAYARRSKRARPRRAREVPLVRIEDRIEWVSRDVMKMTLWFNWSPDAEAEAHEAWE